MRVRLMCMILTAALLIAGVTFAAESSEELLKLENDISSVRSEELLGEAADFNLESEVIAQEAQVDAAIPSSAEAVAMDGLREQLYGGVDNSDLEVDIVWEKSGSKRVIYSGRLGGYLFGIYRHIDFTGIEYQIIFSTLGITDDVIYIVPKSDKPIEDLMDELTPEGDGKFSNSTASGSTIKCDVNLMYDGVYHECIMIKNKQLTVPVKLTNTGSTAKDITCFIGEYDADGRLINEVESTPVRVGANTSVAAALIREFDKSAKSAKIFIWEDGTMRPVTNAISLTETETDYYSNSFSQAQEYDIAYPIEGSINTVGDVDYIKFIPENSGEYTFSCISASSVLTALYNSNQTALQSNSANYNYTLTAGQTYYVRLYGSNSTGEYIFSVRYNVSEEAKGFDVYKFDEDVNIYKKSVLDICNEFYSAGNIDLAKQMYSEYDSILDRDAKLHLLPDFLSDHPKNLSNFDDLLNQYYGIRYEKFAEVKQRYISLIDKYGEVFVSAVNAGSDDNELMHNNREEIAPTPIIGKYMAPLITLESSSVGNISPAAGIQQLAATPSLTIVSTTATSITYNAAFPISENPGNIILMVDFNTSDGFTTTKNCYGSDNNRKSGQYTISGLSPGGSYVLGMAWSTDGQISGGENIVYRFVQLPNSTTENLQLYAGGRVTARMEASDKALASSSDFNLWLNRMDKVYHAYKELTGYTPYNSKQIEMRSTRENINDYFDTVDGENYYWIVYGYFDGTNIFKFGKAYYKGLMRRLKYGDWGWLPMHEMSHVFDSDSWDFDSETLAQFKSYYVMEQLNAKVYDCTENEEVMWYTGSAYYNYLRSNRFMQSYDNSFGKGTYASEGFASILIDIQKQIGWEPFKKTFRYFSDLSSSQVPSTDGEKLKLFLTKLKDYSGRDVLKIITARDKGIIEDWFNIDLEYAEPVYPSVSPGGSSGGGRYDVNVDKGKYTTYQFTPSTSGNYYIYTSPYGGSGVSNDTVLEVYENSSLSGTPIASNDDYGGGRFSKVNVAMTAGKTYYIKVRHYNNGILHAELNITKNIPIQPLTNGGYTDVYTAAGEYAMFSFTPDTSMTYIFEVTNTSNYNTYIKLYENESMTKRIGYDSTKIMANLKAGHTYYLQFSGFLMKLARGRINVRQGQTVQFSKKTDANFIYVNSPEYITKYDIVDGAMNDDRGYNKIFEQGGITGKNTYFQTHLAWYGITGYEHYFPESAFYLDIDLYNESNSTVTVDITNLAYGLKYEVMGDYYKGGAYTITLAPKEHKLLFETIGEPLLIPKSNQNRPTILFDFKVSGGSIMVSSLAAYGRNNLCLKNGTVRTLLSNGQNLHPGYVEVDYFSLRPNEEDYPGKYKGTAWNQSAWTDVNLEFTIDESTALGAAQPIYLKDDFYTAIANPKEFWLTALNPIDDEYQGALAAMPGALHKFEYPSEYGSKKWYFDFQHHNISQTDPYGSGNSVNTAVSNSAINELKSVVASGVKQSGYAIDPDAMSMGEWGATYHYTITVSNTTSDDRKAALQCRNFQSMTYGYRLLNEEKYKTEFEYEAGGGDNDWWEPVSYTVPANSTITFEVVTTLGVSFGGTNYQFVVR